MTDTPLAILLWIVVVFVALLALGCLYAVLLELRKQRALAHAAIVEARLRSISTHPAGKRIL